MSVRRWLFSSVLLIPFFCLALAWAQGNVQPVVSLNGEYIREWLVSGPFSPDDLGRDFLADLGGEANINPKNGDTVATSDGKKIKWKRYFSAADSVDLLDAIGEYEYVTAYAFCEVFSSEAQRIILLVGSDDGAKIWINRDVVYEYPSGLSLTLDADPVAVQLNEGMNRLLVKISNGGVDWGFSIRFWFYKDYLDSLPDAEAGKEGIWRTYSHIDGLIDNRVETIMQDKKGMIWVGTWDGLSRFDGRNWQIYKDAGGQIFSVFQDKEGAIWVGSSSGLSRFQGETWRNYNEDRAPGIVRSIFEDREGLIWAGTRSGVSCFDGRNWRTYTERDGLASNWVTSITQDRKGNLWFGTDRGVSRFDGEEFENFTAVDEPTTHNHVNTIIQDREGKIWIGTGGYVRSFDGENWKAYTGKDGLVNNWITSATQDREGNLWFGTLRGVSRYDGEDFKTFTEEDGLADNWVTCIIQDREGAIWFGTNHSGISRLDAKSWRIYGKKDGLAYDRVGTIIQDNLGAFWFSFYTNSGVTRFDGANWKTFTRKDGLADDYVKSIIQDSKGFLWFGTSGNGVTRFDGREWKTYTEEDGLASNMILTVSEDREGGIWVGTQDYRSRDRKVEGGVSRFDGEKWITYTQWDGLIGTDVSAILQDNEGMVWFGADIGVSRFDGRVWKAYPEDNDQKVNLVNVIFQDNEGMIWFGTSDTGVSRFDGGEWKIYTEDNGLVDNRVNSIIQDNEGIVWFGTESGGISLFDGRCFQSIDSRDGLPDDSVNCLYIDRSDQIWIGTNAGAVRFTPNRIPPLVYITEILADDQTYSGTGEALNLPANVTRVSLGFHGVSFKTRPGGMKYFYQLVGREPNWQGPTDQETIEYFNLKPDEYTFKVQAVDRDLNYSEPASVSIVISAPSFYRTGIFTVLVSIMGSASLLAAIILGMQRWRLAHNEKLRLQNELQDAREMQIALLPEAAPPVEGMEIAGKSITANTVGGDFFDYLELPDGKIGIAIADVSGKGLRAAMNATMANGMMHEVATIEASCGRILSRLNAHLYPLMEKQMFTAFSLAILDQDAGVIHWSSAGQPLPMIKRSDGVSEAEGEGDLPIGMAPDVTYPDYELKLQTGDIVIFYTDGIIEAENETEEMYGTERLEKALSGIDSAMSSSDIIEAILKDVTDFTGSAEQYDDMTIVVIRKL